MKFNLNTIWKTLSASLMMMLTLVCLSNVISVNAEIDSYINFKGKVTETNGSEIDDDIYDFKFEIFNSATGGSAVWSETLASSTRFTGIISGISNSVDGIIYNYNNGSATSTLLVGQYLINENNGVATTIIDFDNGLNTITVATGSPVWIIGDEINNIPYVVGGVIEEVLGTVTDMSGIDFDTEIYLETTFNGEVMQPRKLLTAVPTALNAKQLGGKEASEYLSTSAGIWNFNSIVDIASSSSDTLLTVTQSGAGNVVEFNTGATTAFAVLNDGRVQIGDYVFPTTDGAAGYVLKTDGSGSLSWQVDDGGAGSVSRWFLGGNNSAIYPADINDAVLIGTNATSTDGLIMEVTGNALFNNILSADTLTLANALGAAYGGTGLDLSSETGFLYYDSGVATTSPNMYAYNGMIGIGTSSPSELLTVGETLNNQFIVNTNGVVSDGTWNGDIIDVAYGGLGTTSVAWTGLGFVDAGVWSASSTLSVEFGGTGVTNTTDLISNLGLTTVGLYGINSVGNYGDVWMSDGSDRGGWIASTTLAASLIEVGFAGQVPYYAADGSFLNATSSIFLTPGGNVGIGTSSPSGLLTVGETLNNQFIVNTNGVVSDGTWNGDIIDVAYGGLGTTSVAWTGLGFVDAGVWSASSTLSVEFGGTGTTTTSGIISSLGLTNVGVYGINSEGSLGEVWLADGAGRGAWTATSSLGIDGINGLGLNTNYASKWFSGTFRDTIIYDNGTQVAVGTSSPLDIFNVAGDFGVMDYGVLKMYETAANGNNYVGFQASSTIDSNVVWTLPATVGVSGQALLVGDGGVLDWGDPSGSGSIDSGLVGQVSYYGATGNALSGTSSIFLAASGNVGIGTSSPSALLAVGPDSGSQFIVNNSGVVSDGTWNGDIITSAYGGIGLDLSTDTGFLYFENGNATSSTMFWDSVNSRLGIGTSTPSNSLDVLGNVGVLNQNTLRMYELASNGNNYVALRASSDLVSDITWTLPSTAGAVGEVLGLGAGGQLQWTSTGASASIGSGTTGQVPYYGADGTAIIATSSLMIGANGHVGIGTSTPDMFELQVVGNVGPDVDNVYTLGSAERRWSEVNVGPGSLNIYSSYTDTSNYEIAKLGYSSPAANSALVEFSTVDEADYIQEDFAYATTLTPSVVSGSGITLSLGSGNWNASSTIMKGCRIVNSIGGEAVISETVSASSDVIASTTVDFVNTNSIASGDWSLYCTDFVNDTLVLSKHVDAANSVWTQTVLNDEVGDQVANDIIYNSVAGVYAAGGTAHDISFNATVWSSTDQVIWTEVRVDSGSYDTEILTIIYDDTNNKYVAAGYETTPSGKDAILWESSNLLSWTRRAVDASANDQEIKDIVYDAVNGKYVAAGYSDNGTDKDAVVWESTNLTSWTVREIMTGPAIEFANVLMYSSVDSVYVVGGVVDDTSAIWSSSDLSSWNYEVIEIDSGYNEIQSVMYSDADSKYVIGGRYHDGSISRACAWESVDLNTWTRRVIGGAVNHNRLGGMIYVGSSGKYIATGGEAGGSGDDTLAWISSDLLTWEEFTVKDGAGHQRGRKIILGADSTYLIAGGDSVSGNNDAVVWVSQDPSSYPINNVYVVTTSDASNIDSSVWLDVDGVTLSETLNSQELNYFVSFDARATWKMFDAGETQWRSAARNNAGTWQYNSDATYASETWSDSAVNTLTASLEEALNVSVNTMSGTELEGVSDINWESNGGWSDSIDSIDFAVAASSTAVSLTPVLDQIAIGYESNSLGDEMTMGTFAIGTGSVKPIRIRAGLQNNGLYLDESGNFGVGTTNPTELLTIGETVGSQLLVNESGIISAGTWNGDVIDIAYGGTGADNVSDARSNLGLVISSNIQAWDSDLDTLASLTAGSDMFMVSDNGGWSAMTPANARIALDVDELYAASINLAGSYGEVWMSDGTARGSWIATSSLGLLTSSNVGSLDTSYVAKWDGSKFVNSLVHDNGTMIAIGTTTHSNVLDVDGNIGMLDNGEIRMYEESANGSNYTGFKASSTLPGDLIWTLPTGPGANGQVLGIRDGSELEWKNVAGTGSIGSGAIGQAVYYSSDGNDLTATSAITFGASGRIGIGTTSPSGLLTVAAGLGNQFIIDNTGTVVDGSWHGDMLETTYGGIATSSTSWSGVPIVNSGVWSPVDVLPVLLGGTGSTTAAGTRINLGLEIGADTQGWDADLDNLATLVANDNMFIVGGSGQWNARTNTEVRTTLGVDGLFDYGINAEGISGQIWMSDGNGRGAWNATSSLGLLGVDKVDGLNANYLAKWNGSKFVDSGISESGSVVSMATTTMSGQLTVGETINNQFIVSSNGIISDGTWNGDVIDVAYGGTGIDLTGDTGFLYFNGGVASTSNMIWDSVNSRLGIGTSTPGNTLDVMGDIASLDNGSMKMYEVASNGNNFVGFKASSTLSTNLTWTLPTTSGVDGQALLVNASGDLEWGDVSGAGATIGVGTIGQISYYEADGNALTATSSLYIASSTNIGVGTLTPDNFKLEIAGDVGPSADNIYALGSPSNRFKEINLGPNSLYIYNKYTNATDYERGSLEYEGQFGTDTGLDFDAVDESNFVQEDLAYNVGVTPSSNSGSITLTLDSGNWNTNTKIKQGTRIVGNGGVATIIDVPGASSVINALVDTSFTNTDTITAGNWSVYATVFEGGSMKLNYYLPTDSWDSHSVSAGTSNVYGSVYNVASSTYVMAGRIVGDGYDAVVWESMDLTTWTPHVVDGAANTQTINDILYVNGQYVAAGIDDSGSGSRAVVWTSNDLATWSQVNIDLSSSQQYANSIEYNVASSTYIVAGRKVDTNYNAYVWESSDLVTWTVRLVDSSVNTQAVNSIIYNSNAGVYVAVGYTDSGSSDDAVVWWTDDLAESWNKLVIENGASDEQISSIMYSSSLNKYIAAGYVDDIATIWQATTPAGPWSAVDLNSSGNMEVFDIIYDNVNYRYVAVGTGNGDAYAWISSDLLNWDAIQIGNGFGTQSAETVLYGDNVYVAAGVDNLKAGAWSVGSTYPSGVNYAFSTTDSSQVNTADWQSMQSVAVTEILNDQNIYYTVSFDGRSIFKIYDPTLSDAGWRPVVRDSAGTWQYNSNTTEGATDITWVNASIDNVSQALSQGLAVPANQMTGTEMNALADGLWNLTGGWSTDVNTLDFAGVMITSDSAKTPILDQITIGLHSSTIGVLTLSTGSLGSGVARDMQFKTGDDVRLYIDATSGNIGIGSVAPANALDVNGSIAVMNNGQLRMHEATGSGNNYVAFRASSTLASDLVWTLPTSAGVAGESLMVTASGDLEWGTSSGAGSVESGTIGQLAYYDSVGNSLANTSAIFLDTTGYFGIGTTSPGGLLTVGATSTDQFIVDENGNITDGSYQADIIAVDYGGTGLDTSSASGFLYFDAGVATSTNIIWDTTNSRLGIGTSTPGNTLDVMGDVAALNNGEFRMYEVNSNGNNYAALKASTTLLSDLTWTLPTTAGTDGQFMRLGENGNLTWGTPAGTGLVTSGLTGQLAFYSADGDTISATSTIFVATNSYVGIGTSTPGSQLSVDGDVEVDGSIEARGNIVMLSNGMSKFYELDANGSNSVSLRASTTLASDYIWTLPATGGVDGEFMMMGEDGNMEWNTPAGTGLVSPGLLGQMSFYSVDGDTLSGTSTVFVDTNSFVGIGTSTPTSQLTVAGNVEIDGDTIMNGDVSLQNHGSVKFYEASENGTNSIQLMASSTLAGDIVLTFPVTAGADGQFMMMGADGNMEWNTPVGTGTVNAGSEGQISFYGADGDALSGTSTIFIDTTGFVGIGTSTPGSMLSVAGDGYFGGSITVANSNSKAITLQTSSSLATDYIWTLPTAAGTNGQFLMKGTGDDLMWGAPAGGGTIIAGTTGQLVFYNVDGDVVQGTSDLFLAADGKFGIGTTSPSGLLTVGATSTDQFIVDANGNVTDGTWQADFISSAYGGTGIDASSQTGFLYFDNGVASTSNMIWDSVNSRLGIGTSTPVNALDVMGNMAALDNGEFRMYEVGTNGNNYAALKASTSLSSDLTWTLPTTAGTDGQFMRLGSNGNLTWGTPAGTGLVTSGVTGQMAYYSADGDTISATSTIFVDTNSYVGIGTSTPGSQLTVDGNAEVNGNIIFANTVGGTVSLKASSTLASDYVWTLPATGGTNGEYMMMGLDGNMVWNTPAGTGLVHSGSAGFIPYYTASNDELSATSSIFINADSFVGIGTTTPGSRLSVSGDVAALDNGEFRMYEVDSNGTNYAALKASTTLTSDLVWTLPTTAGTDGQFMMMGDNGNLEWNSPAGTGLISAGLQGQLAYYSANGDTLTGTSTIFIAENGYVGIGTSTSNGLLTVGEDSGSQFIVSASGNVSSGIWNGTAISTNYGGTGRNMSAETGFAFFNVGVVETATMYWTDSAGNLGIGVESVTERLGVNGDLGLFDNGEMRLYEVSANGSNYAAFKASTTLASNLTWTLPTTAGSDGEFLMLDTDNNMIWGSPAGGGTVNSGTIGQMTYYAANGDAITATSSLFLDASGNFGIGTTSPSGLLTVGTTVNDQFIVDENGNITDGSYQADIITVNYGGTGIDASTSNGFLYFDSGVASSSNMIWDGLNSRLGIGTSTPGNTLDIMGNVGVLNQGEFKMFELSGNGNNYVGFKASSTIATTSVWTLPTNEGDNGDVLLMGTDGILSWGAAPGQGTVEGGLLGQLAYYAANGNALTATSSLFLSADGSVGVGTTNPSDFTFQVNGEIGPDVDNAFSLGSPLKRFRDLNLGPDSLNIFNSYVDENNYEGAFIGYELGIESDNGIDFDDADEGEFIQEDVAYNIAVTPSAVSGDIDLVLSSGLWNADTRVKKGDMFVGNGGVATIIADPAASNTIRVTATDNFNSTAIIFGGNWSLYGTRFVSDAVTLNSYASIETWAEGDVVTGANRQEITDIIFVNNKYIALGISNNGIDDDLYIWESADLTTWTSRPVDTATYTKYAKSISYNTVTSRYIIAGYAGNGTDNDAVVWDSADLITWNKRTVASGAYDQKLNDIAFNASGYYAAAGTTNNGTDDDAVIYWSTNLVTWTPYSTSSGVGEQAINSIIFNTVDSKFVAAGYMDSGNKNAVLWEGVSVAAMTQRNIAIGANDELINEIIYDGTNYVAAGYAGNGTDLDAMVWSATTLSGAWIAATVDNSANDQEIKGIIYDSSNGRYVAAGYTNNGTDNDAVVWESSDLTTWTERSLTAGANEQIANSVYYATSKSKYVTVGVNGTGTNGEGVFWQPTSSYFPTGVNYTLTTSDTNQLDSSAWDMMKSVEVSETLNGGTIDYAVSFDDRETWKVYSASSTDPGWRSIARNNAGTWEYNVNVNDGASQVAWTVSSVNDANYALSRAFNSSVYNGMDKTLIESVDTAKWLMADGWSIDVDTIDFAFGIRSDDSSAAPVLDGIVVDSNSGSEDIMTFGTKANGSGELRPLQFKTGDVSAMYIATNGSIGIGTTTPNATAALTVAGDQYIEGDLYINGSLLAAGNVKVTDLDVLAFYEQSGGDYVGLKSPSELDETTIWTLPSEDGTPGQALQTDGSGNLSWTNISGLDASGLRGQVAFFESDGLSIAGTSTLFMDVNEFVGIGTSSPTAKLHVFSEVGPQLKLTQTAGVNEATFTVDDQGLLTIESVATGNVIVDAGSNFGIGTSSPSSALTVGAVGGSQFLVNDTGVVTGGVWNADIIGNAYGGTGINSSLWTGVPVITGGVWGYETKLSSANLVDTVALEGENVSQFNNDVFYATRPGEFDTNNPTDAVAYWFSKDVITAEANLSVIRGGTGVGTLTQNGIIYGNGINDVGVTAAGTNNYILYSNNGTPAWTSAPTITGTNITGISASNVSAGVLGMLYGGAGRALAASAGSLLYSDANSFEMSGVGSVGNLLLSGGTGAPTWTSALTVDVGGNISATGDLTVAGDVTLNGDVAAGKLFVDNADNGGNVGIGTTNPSTFTMQVAGNIGPDSDKLYNLGAPDMRFNDINLGHDLNIYSLYDDGSNFEKGYLNFGGSDDNIGSTYSFDTSDESQFILEDMAYNTTIFPSAITGDIILTLGAGTWDADSRVKKGDRVVFNGGVAILTADPAAQATITARVVTDFLTVATILAGDWQMYGLEFESGLVQLSGTNSGEIVRPSSVNYTLTTSDANRVDSSAWASIVDMAITETLNSQVINYAVSFDARATWNVYDSTGGDEGWRLIARNNAGTMQYNSNVTVGASNITWADSTVNDINVAISEAATVSANNMNGTELDSLTPAQWSGVNGWTTSVSTIDFSATMFSNATTTTPSLDEMVINYNSNGSSILTLGTNGVGNGRDGDIQFKHGDDVSMYINSAGHVGIGTTSPAAMLNIYSGIESTTTVGLLIDSEAYDDSAAKLISVVSDYGSDEKEVFYVSANGTVGFAGSLSAIGADYAEYFYTEDVDLVAGEVVCIDVTRENAVKRCDRSGDSNVMGIVSTSPAIVGNSRDEYIDNSNYVIVALIGQIPAKVSTENGEVRPGDSLTSASSQFGYVMKANPGDSTVGVALEGLLEGEINASSTTANINTGTIKVLISRRNKSLTVDMVESKITDRIAVMEIEDEVQLLISSAVDEMNFDSEIAGVVTEELTQFNTELTVEFDSISGELLTLASSIDGLIARMLVVEDNIVDIDTRVANLENITPNNATSSDLMTITASGNIKLGNNIEVETPSISTSTVQVETLVADVAIVEISAESELIAFVVNQVGDGDVADFQANGVSIVNIAETGRVSVVGEMMVDGRLMVCSGGACGEILDNAVDETMGDMGVEGKVVAGAFEAYCDEGMVWVPGSAKYGTMPGFCVMEDEFKIDNSNVPWNNVSQGEAQLACLEAGVEYHLISENEWMTISENIIRVSDNDIDPISDGLQLASANASSSEITLLLTNGVTIYNFVGGVAEWTDNVITKAGLVEPINPEWQDYENVFDYRGMNIAPPYYYSSVNGIGRIKTGDNENSLRAFVRGESALFDLDMSYAPTMATSTIGFRCAK